MDKRIIKTQDAIYKAMETLLNQKDFSKITIEDILVEAKISRSTFYSHYKTKEEVLSSISDDIFDHVFSHSLKEEKTHDFSKSSIFDYSHLIMHIFYHLHDEKELISAILKSESKDIFLTSMREKLQPISKIIFQEKMIQNKEVPSELYISSVTETFITVMNYWFSSSCKEVPEKITQYFFELIK